jgi:L-fucose isomerase
MLFGHLLTCTAQVFADVRTYWSPQAVQRVTGHALAGRAAGGMIHLINSGAATVSGSTRLCFDRRTMARHASAIRA